MDCDFDAKLEQALLGGGATPFALALPAGIPQELDFAFAFGGRTVAVEIEKANREKSWSGLLSSALTNAKLLRTGLSVR
jgi:hypothetical protein